MARRKKVSMMMMIVVAVGATIVAAYNHTFVTEKVDALKNKFK